MQQVVLDIQTWMCDADALPSQLHSTLVRHGSSSALCAHLSPLRHNRVIVIATPTHAIQCVTIDFHFPVHQLHLPPGCYVKNILIRYNVMRKPQPPQQEPARKEPQQPLVQPNLPQRPYPITGNYGAWPQQVQSEFIQKGVFISFSFCFFDSFTLNESHPSFTHINT